MVRPRGRVYQSRAPRASPAKRRPSMEIRAIGVDPGKSIFHLAAVDGRGQVVQRKKLSRLQLLRYTGTLRACLIGMEAGAGAHYLGRRLLAQGHDVRLMPARY